MIDSVVQLSTESSQVLQLYRGFAVIMNDPNTFYNVLLFVKHVSPLIIKGTLPGVSLQNLKSAKTHFTATKIN